MMLMSLPSMFEEQLPFGWFRLLRSRCLLLLTLQPLSITKSMTADSSPSAFTTPTRRSMNDADGLGLYVHEAFTSYMPPLCMHTSHNHPV
jgi:hypothetical protein